MQIKTTQTKKYFFRLFTYTLLVIFIGSVLGLFLPAKNVPAARETQESRAQDYCNSVSFNQSDPQNASKRREYCKKGFLAALEDNAPKPLDRTPYGPCYTSIYKGNDSAAADCHIAYVYAYEHRQDIKKLPKHLTEEEKKDEELEKEAAKACDAASIPGGSNHNSLQSACESGYIAAKKNVTKNKACSGFPGVNGTWCEKGYDLGKASADSKNENPDCESSGGFGLAWIMCPLIEGMASVTDFIFDKIIEPMMSSVPISTDVKDPGYKTWQGFRFIGNILLIGALLIMVLAQAMGRANVIEAYAVRKMAPRILLGVIAINLSIYICVAAADITNILGQGIGSLLTGPFIGADNFSFNLTQGEGFDAFAEMLAANGVVAIGAGAPLATILIGFITGGGTGVLGSLVFSILIPIVLIGLAILITLAIRQGLLVFLIISSPIAFALYVLPGTEKYFRKWWELFIKTLLVYPIIAVIFALSSIMTVTTVNSTESFVVNGLVALIFTFLPLVLIPFSFRFAGGALSAIYNAANGVRGNLQKDGGWLKTRQQHYGQQNKDAVTRGRSQMARRGAHWEASTNPFKRNLGRYAQRRAHGYTGDIFAAESELNKRKLEESQNAIQTGDDALWRAYTWSGDEKNDTKTENGVRMIRTAGGKWMERSYYDQAVKKFGGNNDVNAYQQGLAYEMSKALTQEDQGHILTSFGGAAERMGMTEEQANGAWIGAAFARQNDNRQWKHYGWDKDEGTGEFKEKMNGLGLLREIDEKQGSYAGTMQSADTWRTMSQEAMRAQEVITGQRSGNRTKANETIERASRIAQSLKSGGLPIQPGEEGEPPQPAGGVQPRDSVGYGAPGAVAEEMRAFTTIVDRINPPSAQNEYGTPSVPLTGAPSGRGIKGEDRTVDPVRSQDDRTRGRRKL